MLTEFQEIRSACDLIIQQRIGLGFHEALGVAASEYIASFDQAVSEVATREKPQGSIVALVDERLPFYQQLGLFGIKKDPAVYYVPQNNSSSRPYGIFLGIVKNEEGDSQLSLARNLPPHLKPATPFEAISVDSDVVLQQSFIGIHGGEFQAAEPVSFAGVRRPLALCLDRFFSRPRLTHIALGETDKLLGLLVTYKL